MRAAVMSFGAGPPRPPRPRLLAAAAAAAAGTMCYAGAALAHWQERAASPPSIRSIPVDGADESVDPALEAAIDRLSQAARANDATTARAILSARPEAARGYDLIGWTPLFRAAFNGSTAVVRLLLPLALQTATTPCSSGDWTPAHVGKRAEWVGGWVGRAWWGWVRKCRAQAPARSRPPA